MVAVGVKGESPQFPAVVSVPPGARTIVIGSVAFWSDTWEALEREFGQDRLPRVFVASFSDDLEHCKHALGTEEFWRRLVDLWSLFLPSEAHGLVAFGGVDGRGLDKMLGGRDCVILGLWEARSDCRA
jgi:hypothetical protein